ADLKIYTLPSPYILFTKSATTEIYTLSLHDALPISITVPPRFTFGASYLMGRTLVCADASIQSWNKQQFSTAGTASRFGADEGRSEEHTSELQSRSELVCRLLLEKKNPMNRLAR